MPTYPINANTYLSIQCQYLLILSMPILTYPFNASTYISIQCQYLLIHFTPASLRGGHNDPPRKNLCDSFVCNSFRTPFSEKKDEWTKKILPSKKIRKKIFGGVPRITELDQNLKKYFQNINLPVCCHFTIWKDKLNLKVDYECLDMYLTRAMQKR